MIMSRLRQRPQGNAAAGCLPGWRLLCLVCMATAVGSANTATETASLSMTYTPSSTLSESITLPTSTLSLTDSYTLTLPTASTTFSISLTLPTITQSSSETISVTLPTASASFSETISLSLPTSTETDTYSLTLPTMTHTVTLTLPTGSASFTLPTATVSTSLTLPTVTSTMTLSLSLSWSMTLPTASATETYSLTSTFSLSLTFTETRMSFDNYTAYIEPRSFTAGQEVRVKVVAQLLDEEIRAINASNPLVAEFIVFKHDAKYGSDCALYVGDITPKDEALFRERLTEVERAEHNKDKRRKPIPRQVFTSDEQQAALHVLNRGHGSSNFRDYPDFSDDSPFVSTFFYTFAVPHHTMEFVVCYTRTVDSHWNLRDDQYSWQLLRFEAGQLSPTGPSQQVQSALQSLPSLLYYDLPDPTAGQYAVIRLLSSEAWNFTYASSVSCGSGVSNELLASCSLGDMLKIVPKGAGCTSERLHHERFVPYFGSEYLQPDGSLSATGGPAVREAATTGGVGLFGTRFSNPLVDKWSSYGEYSGFGATVHSDGAQNRAEFALNSGLDRDMRTGPHYTFTSHAYVYVRLPELQAVAPNTTFDNLYDMCFSSKQQRAVLLGKNDSLPSVPFWRKLFPCNPYHAECTREHDTAHDLDSKSGAQNRDKMFAEFNPSFRVEEDVIGWTLYDLTPKSWGTIVFDSQEEGLLNTQPSGVFNVTRATLPENNGWQGLSSPAEVQDYWSSGLGGDMFRIVSADKFNEHLHVSEETSNINNIAYTRRSFGTFPSVGCWYTGLDAPTYTGLGRHNIRAGTGDTTPWRSTHGGFANEGAEFPIGSTDLRGDPTAAPQGATASGDSGGSRPEDHDNRRAVNTAYATLYIPEAGTRWHVCYRASCSQSIERDTAVTKCKRNGGFHVLPFHGAVNWDPEGEATYSGFMKDVEGHGVSGRFPQKKWLHFNTSVHPESFAAAVASGAIAPGDPGDLLNSSAAYRNEHLAKQHPPRHLYWSMNDTRANTYGPITIATVNASYYEGGMLDTRRWDLGEPSTGYADDAQGSVLRLVRSGVPCDHDGGLFPAEAYRGRFGGNFYHFQQRVPVAAQQSDGGARECNNADAVSDITQCLGTAHDAAVTYEALYYITLPPQGSYRVCHRSKGWNWVEVPSERLKEFSYEKTGFLGDDVNTEWSRLWKNGTGYDFLKVDGDAMDSFSVEWRESRGGMEALFVVKDAEGRGAVGKRGRCAETRASWCDASADVLRLIPEYPGDASRQPTCDINPLNHDIRLTDDQLYLSCSSLSAEPCSSDAFIRRFSTEALHPTPYVSLMANRSPLRYKGIVPADSNVFNSVFETAAVLGVPAFRDTGAHGTNRYRICYKQFWTPNWVMFNQSFVVGSNMTDYEISSPLPSRLVNDTKGHLLAGKYQEFELKLNSFKIDKVDSFIAKLVEFRFGSLSNDCVQRAAHTEGEPMSATTDIFLRGKSDDFLNFFITVPAHPGRYILCVQVVRQGRATEDSMSWYRVRKYPHLPLNEDYSFYVRDNGIRWFVTEGNAPTNQGVLTVNLLKCQSVHTPFSATVTQQQGAFYCAPRSDGGVFNTDDSVSQGGDSAKIVPVHLPCGNDTSVHVGVEFANVSLGATSPNGFRLNLGATDGPAGEAAFIVALPQVPFDKRTTYKVCVKTLFSESDILGAGTVSWVEVGQYYGGLGGPKAGQVVSTGLNAAGVQESMFQTKQSAIIHWEVAAQVRPLSTLVTGNISSGAVVLAGSSSTFVSSAATSSPSRVPGHGFTLTMYPLYTPSPPTPVPPTNAPSTPAPISPAPPTPTPPTTSAPATPTPVTTPVPPPATPAPPTLSPYEARAGRYDLFKLVLAKVPKTRVPESASWGDVAAEWIDMPGASCLSPGVEGTSNDDTACTAGTTYGSCPSLEEVGGEGVVSAMLQFPLRPGKYLVCYRRAHPVLGVRDQTWMWIRSSSGDDGLYVQPSFLEMDVDTALTNAMVFDLRAATGSDGAAMSLASWCQGGNTSDGTAGYGSNDCIALHGSTGYHADLVSIIDGDKSCGLPSLAPNGSAGSPPEWFRLKRLSQEAASVDLPLAANQFNLPPTAFPSLTAYKLCVYKALAPSANKKSDGAALTSSDYVLRAGLVYQLYNRGTDRASGGLSGLWMPSAIATQRLIRVETLLDNTPGNPTPGANILTSTTHIIEFNKTVYDRYASLPSHSLKTALQMHTINSGVTLTYRVSIQGGSRVNHAVQVQQCSLPQPDSPLTALYCETLAAEPTGNASVRAFYVSNVGGSCSLLNSPIYGLGPYALTQKYDPGQGSTVEFTIKYSSGCATSPWGCGIRFSTRDSTDLTSMHSSPYWVAVARREPDKLLINGQDVSTWTCSHNHVCRLRFDAMYQGLREYAPSGDVVVRSEIGTDFAINSAVNDIALTYGAQGSVEYLALPRLLVGVDASHAVLHVKYGGVHQLTVHVAVTRRDIRSAIFDTITPVLDTSRVGSQTTPPAPVWSSGNLQHSYLLTTWDYILRIRAFAADGNLITEADETQDWVITGSAPTRNEILVSATDAAALGRRNTSGTLPPLVQQPLSYDAHGAYVRFRIKNNYGCYRGIGCRLSWKMEKAGKSVITVHVDVAVRVIGDRVRVTPNSATTYRMEGIQVSLQAGQYVSAEEWVPDEFHEGSFFALLQGAPGIAFLPDTSQASRCIFTDPCVPVYETPTFLLRTNQSCTNCTASFHTTAGAESVDALTFPDSTLAFTLLEPIMRLECGIESPNISFAQDSPLSTPFNFYVRVVSQINGNQLMSDIAVDMDITTLDGTGYALVGFSGSTYTFTVENGEALLRNAVLERNRNLAVPMLMRMYVEGPRGTSCERHIPIFLGDVKVLVAPVNGNSEVHLKTSDVEAGVSFNFEFSDGVDRLLQIQANNEPLGWAAEGDVFASPSSPLSSTHDPWNLYSFGEFTFTYGSALVKFTVSTDQATAKGTFTMQYAGQVASPVRRAMFEVCGGVETCTSVYVYITPDIIPPLSLQWYAQPSPLNGLTSSCSASPQRNTFQVGVVFSVPNQVTTLKYLYYSEATRVTISFTRGGAGASTAFTLGNATDTVNGIAVVEYSSPQSGFTDNLKLEAPAIGSSVSVAVTWASTQETYSTFQLLPAVTYAECPRSVVLNATVGGYKMTLPLHSTQGEGWAYGSGMAVAMPVPFQTVVLTTAGERAWSYQGRVRITKMPSISGCNNGGSLELHKPTALNPNRLERSLSGLSELSNGVSTVWASFSAPCEACTLRLDLCYTTATSAGNCLTPPQVPTAADTAPILSNRVKFTKPFSVVSPQPSGAHVTHQRLPAGAGTAVVGGGNVSVIHVGNVFAVSLEAVQHFGVRQWAAKVDGAAVEVKVVNVWRAEVGGSAALRYGNGGFLRELTPADAGEACGGVLRETNGEYRVHAVDPTLQFVYTRPCSLCEVWVHYRLSPHGSWSAFPLRTEIAPAAQPFQARVLTCGVSWSLAPSTPRGRFRDRPFAVSIWKRDMNGFPAWEGEGRLLFSVGDSHGNGGGGVITLEAGNAVEGTSTLVKGGVGTILVKATRACFLCSASLNSLTQSVHVPFSVLTHATHLVPHEVAARHEGGRPVWDFDLYAADENGDRDFTVNAQIIPNAPLIAANSSSTHMVNGALRTTLTFAGPALNVPLNTTALKEVGLNAEVKVFRLRPPFYSLSWSVPFHNVSAQVEQSCGAQSGTLQEGIPCSVTVLSNGDGRGSLSASLDGTEVTASGSCPCGSLSLTQAVVPILHGKASFDLLLKGVTGASCDCAMRFEVAGAVQLAQRLKVPVERVTIAPLLVPASSAQVVTYRIMSPVTGDPASPSAYATVIKNADVTLRIGGYDLTGTRFIDKALPFVSSLQLVPSIPTCFKQVRVVQVESRYEVLGSFKESCRIEQMTVASDSVNFYAIDVRATANPRYIAVKEGAGQVLHLVIKDSANSIVEYYAETRVHLAVNGVRVKTFIAHHGTLQVPAAEAAAARRKGGPGNPPGDVTGQWFFELEGGSAVSAPIFLQYVPLPQRAQIVVDGEQVLGNTVRITVTVLDSHGSRVDAPIPMFVAETAVPCPGYPATCRQRVAVTSLTSAKLLEKLSVAGRFEGYLHVRQGGGYPMITRTEHVRFSVSADGFQESAVVSYRVFASIRVEAACRPLACDYTIYLVDDTGSVLLGDRGQDVSVATSCLSDISKQTLAGPRDPNDPSAIRVDIPGLRTAQGQASLQGIAVSRTCDVLEVAFTYTPTGYRGTWKGRVEAPQRNTTAAVVYVSLTTATFDTEFEAMTALRSLRNNASALAGTLSNLVQGVRQVVVQTLCVLNNGDPSYCETLPAGAASRDASVQQVAGYEVSLIYKAELLNGVSIGSYMASLDAALLQSVEQGSSPLNAYGVPFNGTLSALSTTPLVTVPPTPVPSTPAPQTAAPDTEEPVFLNETQLPLTSEPGTAPPVSWVPLSAPAFPEQGVLYLLCTLVVAAVCAV